MDKGQKKLLMLSLGISLAVLFAVLIITIDSQTLDALKSCMPALLVLALGLHAVSLLFWAARIKLMCRSLGYKVRFTHCVNLVCSNTFVASITPSQIGGEPVRVYELTKAGVPGGNATAVVLMERVFDGIVLAVGTALCVLALGVFFGGIELPAFFMVSAYTAAAVFAGLVLLFFVFAARPKLGYAFMGKISAVLTRRKSPEKVQATFRRIEGYVEQFYTTISQFRGRARSGLFFGLLFSTLYWVNEFIIAFFICMGLGVEPTASLFLLSLIFQILITVILMVPITPGGVGIAEISLGGFYALIIPTAIVGIFVLIYRFIFYYFNLIVGFLASMLIVRREAHTES